MLLAEDKGSKAWQAFSQASRAPDLDSQVNLRLDQDMFTPQHYGTINIPVFVQIDKKKNWMKTL